MSSYLDPVMECAIFLKLREIHATVAVVRSLFSPGSQKRVLILDYLQQSFSVFVGPNKPPSDRDPPKIFERCILVPRSCFVRFFQFYSDKQH